jgi:NAD(P)H-dependent flavin oxidoreductase YrpB (nitropropane dioxygenase family)
VSGELVRLPTRFTRDLGILHPIASAGMARVSQADLVVAVSQAGGLGCLGGVSYLPDALRREIDAIKHRTDRPFAVNLLLADSLTTQDDDAWAPVRRLWESLPADERRLMQGVESMLTPGAVQGQVEVVLAARPAAVVITFGTPAWFVEECHDRGIAVLALVGSIGRAKEAAAAGVDYVVAQGTEGGGHTGYASTLTLVPAVVDAVPVPVLAAGGIADGRGLAASLTLGAEGVWVGTRFIATPEAFGHPAFKQRVVDGALNQTTLTRAYTGKPLRAFANAWTREWEDRTEAPAAFPQQYAVAGRLVETGYQEGDLERGMMPVGQSVQLVHEILPAGEVVRRMVADAATILGRLAGRPGSDQGPDQGPDQD